MRKAWLTLDDTPSPETGDLLAFLAETGIQALIFARGDLAEQNPTPVIKAIQQGHVVASHGYTHVHASKLGLEAAKESISRSKQVLDDLHAQAGVERRCIYFRFPHVDRGMGSWLINPAACSEAVNAEQKELIASGIRGAGFEAPSAVAVGLKNALQDHLRAMGFKPNPLQVKHRFIAETELAHAYDVPFTFSTADWQITARHKGNWPSTTLDDLKRRIDTDEALTRTDTPHIILSHDQAETVQTTIELVKHMQAQGLVFSQIP